MNNLPGCGFCRNKPEILDLSKMLVCCPKEGCPAQINAVTAEVWCDRAPHEKEVMWIPTDEPIFVLRAKDALSLMALYTWIDKAERKEVPQEKLDKASACAEEFQSFQRTMPGGPKMPD
jgi:hypothetical protein